MLILFLQIAEAGASLPAAVESSLFIAKKKCEATLTNSFCPTIVGSADTTDGRFLRRLGLVFTGRWLTDRPSEMVATDCDYVRDL